MSEPEPTAVTATVPEPCAVELDGIHKRFGSRVVLNGVSLSVQPGETVAVIGPSGGGKSTLLRCANGLCPFERGEVRVGPHRLAAGFSYSAARPLRRMLGMIFQDFRLFPHLTVLDNLTEAPRHVLRAPREKARTHAVALLDRVGLADRLDAYPRQLSGGQQQRVAIARAIAKNPSVLLCDEPTGALDSATGVVVLEALERANRELGTTTVIITHNVDIAAMADRVMHLHDGQISEMHENAVKKSPLDLKW